MGSGILLVPGLVAAEVGAVGFALGTGGTGHLTPLFAVDARPLGLMAGFVTTVFRMAGPMGDGIVAAAVMIATFGPVIPGVLMLEGLWIAHPSCPRFHPPVSLRAPKPLGRFSSRETAHFHPRQSFTIPGGYIGCCARPGHPTSDRDLTGRVGRSGPRPIPVALTP